jgi:hypothetical protein
MDTWPSQPAAKKERVLEKNKREARVRTRLPFFVSINDPFLSRISFERACSFALLRSMLYFNKDTPRDFFTQDKKQRFKQK